MTKLTPVADNVLQLPAGRMRSARLHVAHIMPDPNQPRKTFDQDKYDETKASIKAIGLQVPITVNPGPHRDGIQYYYIKYGENRWRIHVDLKLEEIECVVEPDSYDGKVIVRRILTQAAENINRIDHTHSEIAAVYALYFEETKREIPWKKVGEIQEEFALIFGKSTMWVQNYAAMSNLRPELLARVDQKGPTQIPFMAAVALGRNPKERQTGILHGAEILAGSRRDMLYRYVLEGTHKAKKANGERVGHRVAATKHSLMNIPANLQKNLDYFGAGMQPLDRQSYLRETLESMSAEELSSTDMRLNSVLENIDSLRRAVQGRLLSLGQQVIAPIVVIDRNDHKEEAGDSQSRTPLASIWPGLAAPAVKTTEQGSSGYTTRQIKGTRYK